MTQRIPDTVAGQATWQPITTAPKRKMLLVWGNGGPRFSIQDEDGQWRSPMGHPKLPPKCWMPLPEPPK